MISFYKTKIKNFFKNLKRIKENLKKYIKLFPFNFMMFN